MTDCYPTVWDILLDEHLELRKLGYSVAYEINLSVSAHLEIDGIADNFTTKRYQFGMNRITVRWRSAHDTHIPGAIRENWRVRGIGVALIVSVSTFTLS